MKAEDVITKLRAFINDDDNLDWYESFGPGNWSKHPNKTEHGWVVPGLPGYVTCVDSYGGEGEGDTWYRVFKLRTPQEDRYFYLPGWWQSYHGATINDDEIHEVFPRQVVKTEWDAKKESK